MTVVKDSFDNSHFSTTSWVEIEPKDSMEPLSLVPQNRYKLGGGNNVVITKLKP